ncbi:2Fe-2S iron-sulfur cluster-binding protein [Cohnella fermenti]|uniref:(2Fe-2S)-binding protein n=1 Tax=Cohnella fermenti TaxID=2565925 RepID=A0A4S4BTE7_9BACL|nr:2Fe-2S iron-sulfur cluster-binding protein [Cohnella fermenti]THF78361.1 (2Fe-2S)-binding protein [Cohnella fermenti]
MITLTGRTLTATVEPRTGVSLLTLAAQAKIDWQFNCSRGTCARCRCLVSEGADLLEEVTDAEWYRLGEDELEQGYRLGCQAVVARVGTIVARNKTYF